MWEDWSDTDTIDDEDQDVLVEPVYQDSVLLEDPELCSMLLVKDAIFTTRSSRIYVLTSWSSKLCLDCDVSSEKIIGEWDIYDKEQRGSIVEKIKTKLKKDRNSWIKYLQRKLK